MGSTRSSTVFTAFLVRDLNLFIVVFILFCLSSSVKVQQGFIYIGTRRMLDVTGQRFCAHSSCFCSFHCRHDEKNNVYCGMGRRMALWIPRDAGLRNLEHQSNKTEINGHPPYNGDWHLSREVRAVNEPLHTNGKRPEASNARQASHSSQRQATPSRSSATTGKDEQPSERRHHTRIPVIEKKVNIGELERDPSTDSDEKTRAARKSPTVKITAPIPPPSKETTQSPLSIQVKTFTPKPNVSAVIEVIADRSNIPECKEDKGKGPLIEHIHLPGNMKSDELRLFNWYPMSSFKDPRAPLGSSPVGRQVNEILPVEEIVLFGPDAGYSNQQPIPIYSPFASDTQSFVPGTAALGITGYEPSVIMNALATPPLASQWLQNMQPSIQKYVTRSFHLKSDPKMEWVPI